MKKSLLYRILSKLVPELKVLGKNISWNQMVDHTSDCNISSKSKINSPFNLQNVTLGDFSYIDRNSFASHVNIGKFCSIGPNFMCGWGVHPTNGISTSPMFYSNLKQNGHSLSPENKFQERKQTTIGNDVFIGMNVTILDGITIGHGAVIGAGAVVSKDIPPYAIAVGNPIEIKKFRFSPEQIQKILNIAWWDFKEDDLKDIEKHFFDIDSFIEKQHD